MDIRVLGRKGVAGTLAVVAGAVLLALEFYGPGAAILVAGIVDLAVDGLSAVARHTRRQWKSRRA
jgi:membrane protein implicated in regulation of membrane protease activity